MANKIVDGVTNSTKLPVSYKDFVKDPVKALLYIALAAIAGLYIDGKVSSYSQISRQNEKIEVMEVKVDNLTSQLRKSDSTLAAASAKFALLQELGKIK
jgi:hypothetical protein